MRREAESADVPGRPPGPRRALAHAHLTGSHRTLSQDPVFAIDQLVEIGIRALSPAVNDTFTALTCIDWLSAGLCRISGRVLREGVYRDEHGRIRLIEPGPSYSGMVNRSFDKLRQAAREMPAVIIRRLDSLGRVVTYTTTPAQREALLRQATMILDGAEADLDNANDLADIRRRYDAVVVTASRMRPADPTSTVDVEPAAPLDLSPEGG